MRSVVIILFSLLAVSAWAQAPIYRQFFTTNAAPIVDVVAGSNATVQASTPAANIRRFTVNAIPSSTATNVYGTNVIGAVAEATHATNADNATYVTTATLTNQIDTTSVIGDAIYGGTILATNGNVSGPLTVATLPGSPSNGQVVWCSDVVTSRGIGDYVYYDGASWRTREHVVATADMLQWIMNAKSVGLNATSPSRVVRFFPENGSAVSGYQGRAAAVGGSGGITYDGTASTFGSYVTYNTFSGAAAYSLTYGPRVNAITSTSTNACGGNYSVSALCDGTEKYIVVAGGFDNAVSSNAPVSGVFFLYDMYTNYIPAIVASAITYTNNWICVSAKASAYTFADSGLPVGTSTTAPANLAVVLTSSAVYYYTNGVPCFTNTTGATIPTVNLNANKTILIKTAGTTGRNLYEWTPFYNFTHTAINY